MQLKPKVKPDNIYRFLHSICAPARPCMAFGSLYICPGGALAEQNRPITNRLLYTYIFTPKCPKLLEYLQNPDSLSTCILRSLITISGLQITK